MSGGSLDYLFSKEPEELFYATYSLEQAEKYLIECGAVDVAKDVRRLIEYVLSARNRIEVMQENLREVFKAIEWEQSGDSGKDRVDRAIAAYRDDRARNIIDNIPQAWINLAIKKAYEEEKKGE